MYLPTPSDFIQRALSYTLPGLRALSLIVGLPGHHRNYVNSGRLDRENFTCCLSEPTGGTFWNCARKLSAQAPVASPSPKGFFLSAASRRPRGARRPRRVAKAGGAARVVSPRAPARPARGRGRPLRKGGRGVASLVFVLVFFSYNLRNRIQRRAGAASGAGAWLPVRARKTKIALSAQQFAETYQTAGGRGRARRARGRGSPYNSCKKNGIIKKTFAVLP